MNEHYQPARKVRLENQSKTKSKIIQKGEGSPEKFKHGGLKWLL
jgi:hypothetical protein